MLPLNDTEPNRYSPFPVITVTLILVNCFVFFNNELPVFFAGTDWPFLMKYATTPRLMMTAQGGGMLSNITTMFLHADLIHLGGNMLFLWVFGRRVEDACGSIRFLAFYLLAGTVANMLNVLIDANSLIPCIGASGAISGLIGAYLLLYPGGRIRTLVFISGIPLWPRIRGGWVALYFVGLQIIPALQVLFKKADYSTAYWAHLGGIFSAVFIFLFLRPDAFARYLSDTAV